MAGEYGFGDYESDPVYDYEYQPVYDYAPVYDYGDTDTGGGSNPVYDYGDTDTGGNTDTGVDFTGGETQDHDLTTTEALLGQGFTQDELGNFYKIGSQGQYSFVADDGKIYNFDAARGGFFDAAGRAISGALSKTLGNKLKSTFTKKVKNADGSESEELDWTKLLTLGGGALAMAKSNNLTQPAGYQGKIPKYTATRQAPGIGQLLSGNVAFKTPDGAVVNPNVLSAPTGIAPPVKQEPEPSGIAAAKPVQPMAKGGALESGGFVIPADVVSHLGNGSSEAGLRLLAQRYGATPIKGKGDGMSDSIKTTIDGRQPARVANEEARLTKAQVQAAGGAQKLYAMMDRIRQARTGTKKQGKQINPGKFMPGGAVGYNTGGTTTTAPKLPAGTTGTESSLSNWAGEYVTDMLGKGQALSEMPYEQYKGPLTAGASGLQSKVSTGLGSLNFPGNLGTSFSSSTAPTIGAGGQPTGGGGIASNYMNPYLSSVLNPQLAEIRRQAEITNQSNLGGLTKSGAFGGGRQAIMESEAGRNLLNAQNTAIGQGYANAYDKAMQQFNTEQGQAKDLAGLMASQGAVDRGITAEGIAADKAQFEEARLNPYKMVQFQQSLLSGLPLAAQTYNQAPTDNLTQFANASTTINQLLKNLGQKPG